MAGGFDIYRAGYNRGVLCGLSDMRRLARWELLVRSPLTWLPFVDADSYVRGYLDGYWFGSETYLIVRNGNWIQP